MYERWEVAVSATAFVSDVTSEYDSICCGARQENTSRWSMDNNNVQVDSRGDNDGGDSRHNEDHEESCVVLDKSRTIVKEGVAVGS
jgi:hypothetical protein